MIFGIFIGIDNYQDNTIPSLNFAENDARAIHRIFSNSIECSTTQMIASEATARGIKQAIGDLYSNSTPEDTVIIYFAGHGAIEQIKNYDGTTQVCPYLIPYDTDQNNMEATALAMENDIARLMNRLPARNVIFFIDACYSGRAGGRTFPIGGDTSRNFSSITPTLDKITGKGRLIVAAATESQVAFEHAVLEHGVFTYCLINKLRGVDLVGDNSSTTFAELYSYLEVEVPTKAKELVDCEQNPLYRGEVVEEIRFPLLHGLGCRTLRDFPQDFLPLTVVVGDRREPEPKSVGDVFAYSASPCDLTWILELGLPRKTEIVSDKVFVVADEQELRDRFSKKNLLVIGSPASNLLTRIINNNSLFRFQVAKETLDSAKEIQAQLHQIKNDPLAVRRFALDPKNQENLGFYMNQFRKAGFIDPTKPRGLAGFYIPPERDYGVVSMARHPYSDCNSVEYIAIVVAGVHLPGTMYAIKYLCNPDTSFHERPLGGVLGVNLLSTKWEQKVLHGDPEWSTETYLSPDGLQERFRMLKMMPNRPDGIGDDEIDDCISFIQQIITSK